MTRGSSLRKQENKLTLALAMVLLGNKCLSVFLLRLFDSLDPLQEVLTANSKIKGKTVVNTPFCK